MLRQHASHATRLGELLALSGEDIDPLNGTVNVGFHLVRIEDKGLLRVPNRKGNAPGLTLRIPSWSVLCSGAESWRREEGRSSRANGEWLDPSNVVHRIQEAFSACGYGWVTSHVFRKTVASVLDEAGLPLSAIADQLGNTQQVADKHYRKRRVANEATAHALEDMIGEARR